MTESPLGVRLDALRRSQNADGGWGYFEGKESWLEPTAYAAMGLHGEPQADRAWKLLQSWQLPDGSWKPSAKVSVSNWGTSLCVTLAAARGDFGAPFRNGVDWLVGSQGEESGWFSWLMTKIGIQKPDHNYDLKAWPWKPGNSGWLEPTVHAIVALKQASAKAASGALQNRIKMGEARLWDVRDHDGGWNYGAPTTVGFELPSYPETTALALVALQGKPGLGNAFDLAARMMKDTPSPLARAWLTIALRLNGGTPGEIKGKPSADIMITAVEALAAEKGNWKLMQTGGAA